MSRWINNYYLHLDYLGERKHLQTLPLSTLSETRLGIDASHYLRILLDDPKSREPLLPATGGLPLALTSRIESDLRILEKLHIKPVFVFPGLLPNKKQQRGVSSNHMEACKDRKLAWDQYENGKTEAATKLFEGRSNVVQWDLWRSVLRIFRNRNVEFIVAPYIAWAQVSITPSNLIICFSEAKLVQFFFLKAHLSSTTSQILYPFYLWSY